MDPIFQEKTPERTRLINQIGRPFAFTVFSITTAIELQSIREQIYTQVQHATATEDIRLIHEITDEIIIRCQQATIPLKPKQSAALNFLYIKRKSPAYICRHLNIELAQFEEFIKECPATVFDAYFRAMTKKEHPIYL